MKIRSAILIGMLTALLSVAVLLVSGQFGGTATTAQTPQDQGIVSYTPGAAQLAAAQKYWTPERMAAAKPLDLISVEGEPPEAGEAAALPQGPPVVAPSGTGRGAVAEALEATVDSISVGGAETLGYAYPFPFNRFQVFDAYKTFPYSTMGVLFFTQGGVNYRCSAATTNSPERRLIWTVGHCVAAGDGATWSTNVLFVPQYKNGNAPKGTWAGCQLFTMTSWFANGNLGEDMGAIKACDRPDGTRIGDVVGYLGFTCNASRVQLWNLFGYPAAAPFNGKTLQTCQASHAVNDNNMNPATIGIGCDMTGGCSGGPWVQSFVRNKAGANNYLNGDNSYKYINPAQPLALYGPYFGQNACDLRTFAINNGA